MFYNIICSKCCSLKNSIYFFTAFIAFSMLAGCRIDPEKELKKEWYVTAYHTPLANIGGKGPTNVFRFYGDGKYSQFGKDNYSFGRWRFNKPQRIIHLQPEEGKLEILDSYYYITTMQATIMELVLYRNIPVKKGTEELYFTLEALANKNSKYDPYHPEMHRWRHKPEKPETDEQIKGRAINYLTFLKTLYQHAIDNDFSSLMNDWYPHPLRMHYGNGVRMAYSDELDDWNDCFYDSAQAVKGYQCISGTFQNIKLKSTKNKLERNLDVVEQLLSQMK